MALMGKYPEWVKIITDNQTIKHIEDLNYPGYDITYERKKDILNKTNKYHIYGITLQTLRM